MYAHQSSLGGESGRQSVGERRESQDRLFAPYIRTQLGLIRTLTPPERSIVVCGASAGCGNQASGSVECEVCSES